ncbi:MAG: GSCFA domain-containing protein [Albidovulum sp.]|uniref:GSCFA domain-containing protein n=1 Tax=Albidovulum sp. TaxID=1872424 RepID=UPI003C9F32AC
MSSPYSDLPTRAFWRNAVATRAAALPEDIYRPRFDISAATRIVTAGSCFAQHVGAALKRAGFSVIDAEPAPRHMSAATARRFGFGLYSARYGNIYTSRQLAQLWGETTGRFTPAYPVWQSGDRFYDAMRPGVEPDGFSDPTLPARHRAQHLVALRDAFHSADLMIFTFGLTEAWHDPQSGTVYPTAPGTVADPPAEAGVAFVNFSCAEVFADFAEFRGALMEDNPSIRFLVTVSPVPLTATASGAHVEVANSYSKSALRAVCHDLTCQFDNVDYYPSYEIVTSRRAEPDVFDANLRSVSATGVSTALTPFLTAHGAVPENVPVKAADADDDWDDPACEEALLEAFAP